MMHSGMDQAESPGLQSMSPLVWQADGDGNNFAFNGSWAAYTGQTYEQSQQRGWLNVFHPQDREHIELVFRTVCADGQSAEIKVQIASADGNYKFFQLLLFPVLDESASNGYWLGTAIHIPKKSAQTIQSKSGKVKNFESFFNIMNEGACIVEVILDEQGTTTDYRFLEINRAFEEQTGLKFATGKRMRDLEPSHEHYWFEIYGEVAKTRKPVHFVHEASYLAGGVWYEVSAFPFGEPEQLQVGILFNDITELKKSEMALKVDEARQTFLLQLSDAFRSLTDTVKIQTKACQLLGELLNVDRAYFGEINEREGWVHVREHYGRSDSPSMAGTYRLEDYGWSLPIMRRGETIVFENVNVAECVPPSFRPALLKIQIVAHIAVPIIRAGNLVGILCVTEPVIRAWSKEEIRLIQEVATRLWSTFERARAEESLKHTEHLLRIRLESEVTERVKELRESRDQLRSVFDTSLVQMSILQSVRDEKGLIEDLKIVIANKELEKETGRADLAGKLYAKEFPGIRSAGIFDLIVTTIETGKSQQMEYYYPFEGFNKWFSCMFVKLGDGVVATNMDITARKRAEEEQLKNYHLLRQSEEIALLGSWEYNLLSGSFTWSDGMHRLFHLDHERKIEPEIYLEYTTLYGLNTAKRVVSQIKTGDTDFEETLEVSIDGHNKILHLKAAIVKNQEGYPVKVLGVNLDVSAMRAAEDKIRKMEVEQQREIVRITFSTLEEERRRISESLHSGLGQILYGVKLSLNNLTIKNAASDPEFYKKELAYIDSLLSRSIIEARRISHELMPMTLYDHGLKAAINDICSQLTDGLKFTCKVSGYYRRLDKYIELAVYRAVQELMVNVIKHANATEANVKVHINHHVIHTMVEDNGQGFSGTENQKPGIGISALRSRISLLNGTMDIESVPGKGTRVSINIPFNANRGD